MKFSPLLLRRASTGRFLWLPLISRKCKANIYHSKNSKHIIKINLLIFYSHLHIIMTRHRRSMCRTLLTRQPKLRAPCVAIHVSASLWKLCSSSCSIMYAMCHQTAQLDAVKPNKKFERINKEKIQMIIAASLAKSARSSLREAP